jgi:hypothetical protein
MLEVPSQNLKKVFSPDSYHCPFQTKRRMDSFGITFDRNKIEICSFPRSKEEVKLHRITHVRFSQQGFSRVVSQVFQKINAFWQVEKKRILIKNHEKKSIFH